MEALEYNYFYHYGESYQPIDKIVSTMGKKLLLTYDEIKSDIQSIKNSEDPQVVVA